MGNAVEEGPDIKIEYPVLAPTTSTSDSECVMGGTPRTVAVTVPVEDRLQLVFQQHRCCGLGNPVHRIWHSERPHPGPMIFRYLHRSHRSRKITSRTHPVPQLVEVGPLLAGEHGDAHGVHTRCSAVRLDLLPRLEHETLANIERLHLQLWSAQQLIPQKVDRQVT